MPEEVQVPERLWKYRPWNPNTKRLLVDGEVYFANIQQLNDPFEFRWREQFPNDEAEIDVFVKELCAQTFPNDTIAQRKLNYGSLMAHARAIVEGRKDGIVPTLTKFEHGVFCLSETNDDILMWSHYADCHKGVCVAIRPDCMGARRILPVEYSDRIPLIDVWLYVRKNAEAFVALSRTKASHWRYEREWRTIDRAGAHKFRGCVDRVVIGALANPETKSDILEAAAAASKEIRVCEATLSESHYKLNIARVI